MLHEKSYFLAILRCQFDSYPEPKIQWVKMIRTPMDPEGGQVLVQDTDPQVIDILTRQIGPTIYETQLTVALMKQINKIEMEHSALIICLSLVQSNRT